MRHVFIWISIFVLTACSTSQSVAPKNEPTGSVTGILLTVDKTPETTFADLVDYFEERGFKLDKVNHFQHYLRTGFMTMGSEMYTYSIEAVIPPADSTVVVFRGEAIGPHLQSSARISKDMDRFSSSLWDRFQQAVIEFPHNSVYYTSD